MMAHVLSRQFQTALELRCSLGLNNVLRKCGLQPTIDEDGLEVEAFVLGNAYARSEGVLQLFSGTVLADAYADGLDNAVAVQDEIEIHIGSEEEWDALSSEEKDAQWDAFHERCAEGIADAMYFYRVMMNHWLKDYVGH